MAFEDQNIGEIEVTSRQQTNVFYPRCVVRIEAIFVQAIGEERFTGWECVPRSVEWGRNNPRAADTCRITLNYRDFPIDPRMLSAAHVQVYAADVRGHRNELPLTTETLRFQGFVDVPESTLSDDVAQVTFDCRDYTSLYLNRPWRRVADEVGATDNNDGTVTKTEKKSRIRIPKNVTLEKFIEQIREKIRPPGASSIESPPTIFERQDVKSGIVAKRVGRTDLSMRQNDTAWDVLTLVCELFGQVPVWDLDPNIGPVLRIRTPAEDGRNFASVRFGQNIKRLTFKRNLQAPERKAIRLIIWNPRTGRAVEGLWPKAGNAAGERIKKPKKKQKQPTSEDKDEKTLSENAKRVSTKRITSELKRVQYILEGDFGQAEATNIARTMYEEQAQNRIMGSVEMADMIDLTGGDVLALANGDRLAVELGAEAIFGTSHLEDTEAIAFLSNPARPNSLPEDIARIIVQSTRAVEELTMQFFVLEASHKWDSSEGYSVEISFTDFLFDKVETAR